MNFKLNRTRHLRCGLVTGISLALLLCHIGLRAQVTFNTVVTGDSRTGSVQAEVLNAAHGTGAAYYRVPDRSLYCIAADAAGNIAFSDSISKICRIDGTHVIAWNAGGAATALAVDQSGGFLYAAITPVQSNYTVSAFPSTTQLTIPIQSSAALVGAFIRGAGITGGTGISNTFVIVQSGSGYTDLITSKPFTGTVGNYDIRKSVISRFIWSDNGANTSVGYFVGKALNTSTNTILNIPLISSGDLVYLNGATTRSAAYFATIGGIALDPCGNLYYTDKENNVVRKISVQQVSGTATAASTTLTLSATPNAAVQKGDLISGVGIPADTYINNISGTTLTLSAATTSAVGGSSGLVIITGVSDVAGTFGTAGNLGNGAVALNALLSGPSGLAFDQTGDLFVQDSRNLSVRKIAAPVGVASMISALNTSGVALSAYTTGLSCDSSGNVFVSDNGPSAQKILKISSAGTVTVAAGNGPLTVASSTTTSGSATVSSASGFGLVTPGMYIRGTGIPLGTKVLSVGSASSVTLTGNATVSGIITTIFSTRDSSATAVDSSYLDNPMGLIVNAAGDQVTYLERGMNLIRSVTMEPAAFLRAASPVPMSYTVQLKNESTVGLRWSATLKDKHSFFTIERSADGNYFSKIAQIPAKSLDQSDYELLDEKPLKGLNYYRLNLNDHKGGVKDVGTKSVQIKDTQTITLYPNPSNGGGFSIRFSANDDVDPTLGLLVTITRTFGKQVYSGQIAKTADGVYQIRLSYRLAPGIYAVQLNGRVTKKLMVQ
jgi:hypothetical protein